MAAGEGAPSLSEVTPLLSSEEREGVSPGREEGEECRP